MFCTWVLADARDAGVGMLTRRRGRRARQSAGVRQFAIIDNVNGFGAPTVLLHCHEHGFMPLHE